MRDSVVAGTIAGVTGGLFSQVFIWVFYLIGISTSAPSYLGAYIMIKPGLDISSLPAQGLGMAVHLALGILLGIIAVYLLRFMGTDYIGIKGLVYGLVVYVLIYGIIAKTVVPVSVLQPDLATSIIYLFGNLFFGLTCTYAAAYFMPVMEEQR